MAIDKIQTSGLGENIEIGGTEAAKMPVGTTAERANVQAGDIRFNSTLSLMEYYDGVRWKSIDSPPTISSVSPSTFDASGDTITVNGSNFQTGVNVTLIASDGGTYTPDSVTRVSDTQITFDISSSIVADPDDPFDVKVENSSGLSVTSADALTVAGTITLNTSAGSLGTVYDSLRAAVNFDLGVTDSSSESDVTFTYSVASGSLPSGLSLNTSTGAVTGTPNAVGSDTTSNFTISYSGTDASDSNYSATGSTAYSYTVAAPVITSYTSVGSGTFSVPSGITAVDVLVVGGGGSGGGSGNDDTAGGGGGAGGLIYRPEFPVTPGGSISYTVGAGAPAPGQGLGGVGQIGGQSIFGSLTALGGGGGRSYTDPSGGSNAQGGSGGGAGVGSTPGGQAQQPTFASGQDSSTYGFGNSGGNAEAYSPPAQGANSPNAGGGGGAGSGGYDGPQSPSGGGGQGKQYDISGSPVYYAGGGAGGGGQGQVLQGGGGTGRTSGNTGPGSNATANRGGGGGGGNTHGSGGAAAGGAGGSGIVIVKY